MNNSCQQIPFFNDNENFVFSIDRAQNAKIEGWYLNKTLPHNDLLYLAKNGEIVNTMRANLPRVDVQQSEYNILNCGFSFDYSDLKEGHIKLTNSDKLVLWENDSFKCSTKTIYIDISDLVFYLGHHENVTGIQRVQANFLKAIINQAFYFDFDIHIISFNTRVGDFYSIDVPYFLALVDDIKKDQRERKIAFNQLPARDGILPNSTQLKSVKRDSFICLLGAAWVLKDYFAIINYYKREFNCKFLATIHDLIPIYCKEHCDQGTVNVFQKFLETSFYFVDGYICVSENTKTDLLKYAKSREITPPPIYVSKEGAGLVRRDNTGLSSPTTCESNVEDRYILFVATLEGRKNHRLIFDLMKSLLTDGHKIPKVICVGRYGWKIDDLIDDLFASNFLDNKFIISNNVSDDELINLYQNAWFTVFPSLYEGWGLPVTESLEFGKLCICSNTSSLLEAGQGLPIYLDPYDFDQWKQVLLSILRDPSIVTQKEEEIINRYARLTWDEVAHNLIEYIDTFSAKTQNTIIFETYTCYTFQEPCRQSLNNFDSLSFASYYNNPFLEDLPVVFFEALISTMRYDYRQWGSIEDGGIWGKYPEFKIKIPVKPTADDLLCYIYFNPIAPLEGCELTITIGKNRKKTKKIILSDTKKLIKLNLCKETRIEENNDAYFLIKFSIPKDNDKSKEISAIDERCLFLLLKNLILIDQSDLKSQIEILSNFCGI